MKQRKPRSLRNMHGSKNYDLCEYCGCANCNTGHSIGNTGYAMTKIQDRLHSGKCMGCGKEKRDCSCKSHKIYGRSKNKT